MSRATRKDVLCHMRTTKMHLRSLISAFIVHCLDSVMSLVSATKISNLMLASIAEQAGLSLTWSETPEDTFSHDRTRMFLWRTGENYPLIITKYRPFPVYYVHPSTSILASSLAGQVITHNHKSFSVHIWASG